METAPPQLAAILLIDLDRSVAPSHIPGRYQRFEDGWMLIPPRERVTKSKGFGKGRIPGVRW